jgi:hypothetical protein
MSLMFSTISTVVRALLLAPLIAFSGLATAASPIGSDPVWLGTMGNTLFFMAL